MKKHTRTTRRHSKRRSHRKTRRGGGYGFGGSILSDAGGSNAGNALWNPDTSQDCTIDAYRGGNGAFAGGRRRKGKKTRGGQMCGGQVSNESLDGRGGNNPSSGGRRRRSLRRRGGQTRGGAYAPVSGTESRAIQLNPALIQSAPRTGYTFDGSGVAGTVDPVRLNG
jgi:hypothetical protein